MEVMVSQLVGYQRGANEARASVDQNHRLKVGANKQIYVTQVDITTPDFRIRVSIIVCQMRAITTTPRTTMSHHVALFSGSKYCCCN